MLEKSKEEVNQSIKQREVEKRKASNQEQNKRLRSSGMTRSRAGYVFKGISPKVIELAAKKRVVIKKKETEKKIEKPPSPKMGVEPLNPDGSVGVTFNQKMLAPEPGKIDQC